MQDRVKLGDELENIKEKADAIIYEKRLAAVGKISKRCSSQLSVCPGPECASCMHWAKYIMTLHLYLCNSRLCLQPEELSSCAAATAPWQPPEAPSPQPLKILSILPLSQVAAMDHCPSIFNLGELHASAFLF